MIMKSSRLLAMVLTVGVTACGYSETSNNQAYLDPKLPVEERVKHLMAQMTLEEKVAQVCSESLRASIFSEEGFSGEVDKRSAMKNGMGQLENTNDKRTAKETALAMNKVQKFLIENTRLKIPAMIGSECLHGHAGNQSTTFPTPIALACSWNPELVNKAFDIVGREARLRGATEAHTPVLDIGRDPRWGRIEETYGEDTYLVSQMGYAAVTGMQGGNTGNPGTTHIVASPKHFAGYAQAAGGRNFAPTEISTRTFHDEILPPFKKAVTEAKAMGIMASHCEIDGVPAHGNKWLLTDLLKKEWRFEGMVVSDYMDIARLEFFHRVAEGPEQAARLALMAGLDLDLPGGRAYSTLTKVISKEPELLPYLDESVRRILTLKFKMGLFDNPYSDVDACTRYVGCEENLQVAEALANETIVLLKNRDNLLPLDAARIKRIAVVGPNAKSLENGVYTVHNDRTVSFLDGIRGAVGPQCEVVYAKGCEIARFTQGPNEPVTMVTLPLSEEEAGMNDAVSLASGSDVIVACVGGMISTSKEAVFAVGAKGDRADITLLGNQEELIRRLVATGKPVIVVLKGGKPYAIPEIDRQANAILSTFYGGERSGVAVGNVLFGKVNPSGRLSISFPRHVGQLPVHYSQKRNGFYKDYLEMGSRPLYPFGYGLSYSSFEMSDLKLANDRITRGEPLAFTVKVKNTGSRKGAEVVQVYFSDEYASVTRPEKLLVRFQKVMLEPGEEKTLSFVIDPEKDLSFTGIDYQRVVEPGTFTLHIGNSSANVPLKREFHVN